MRFVTLTKLFLLFGFLAPARAAETEDFVVYEALHHSADELRKAAEGVVNGARVSNLGSKLIIYGTKSQRDAVLKVLSAIDHEIGNFSVQLRLAARGRGAREAAGVSGTVGTGGAALSAHAGASSGEASQDSVQELTVSDGGTAKLYGDAGIYPRAVSVHVRAIGKSGAHVEIREADASALGEQALVTELDVPLDEWRSIGGVTRSSTARGGGLFGRAKRSTLSSEDVQLRVSRKP